MYVRVTWSNGATRVYEAAEYARLLVGALEDTRVELISRREAIKARKGAKR